MQLHSTHIFHIIYILCNKTHFPAEFGRMFISVLFIIIIKYHVQWFHCQSQIILSFASRIHLPAVQHAWPMLRYTFLSWISVKNWASLSLDNSMKEQTTITHQISIVYHLSSKHICTIASCCDQSPYEPHT